MGRVFHSAFHGLGAGLLGLACALGPGARAETLGPLVQITAGDLFGSCTADQVTAQEAAYDSIFYQTPQSNLRLRSIRLIPTVCSLATSKIAGTMGAPAGL